MAQNKMRLGEFLIKNNIITQDELTQALSHQETRGGRLGDALIYLNIISEDKLLAALRYHLRVPAMDLENRDIPKNALTIMPPSLARKYHAIPVQLKEESPGKKNLLVAMSNPMDVNAIEEIEFAAGIKVVPVLAKDSQIHALIRRYYEEDSSFTEEATAEPKKPETTHEKPGKPGELNIDWKEELDSIPSLKAFGWDKESASFEMTEQSEEMKMLFGLMNLLMKKGLVTEEELEEIRSRYL
jgi:hypothetical protein